MENLHCDAAADSATRGVAASGKSVDDVDALLKIKQDGLAAFVSRKLDTLDEYIKLFNSKKSAHESLIGVLATAFGGKDQLAATLAAAKRYPFMSAKVSKLQITMLKQ